MPEPFKPKDVDLNTDESGCAICGGTGIKPLFGSTCNHKMQEDHCEGEDNWKYESHLHAEGELAKGREGEDGWETQKVDKDWEILKNTNYPVAKRGRLRGKYGSEIENVYPPKAVNCDKVGWVKISEIKNCPRELLERYMELYLE